MIAQEVQLHYLGGKSELDTSAIWQCMMVVGNTHHDIREDTRRDSAAETILVASQRKVKSVYTFLVYSQKRVYSTYGDICSWQTLPKARAAWLRREKFAREIQREIFGPDK